MAAATTSAAWLAHCARWRRRWPAPAPRSGLVELATALEVGGGVRRARARCDRPNSAARAVAGGNPVIPLVRAMRAAVDGAGRAEAAAAVHLGATSQDILDTALMLVAQPRRSASSLRRRRRRRRRAPHWPARTATPHGRAHPAAAGRAHDVRRRGRGVGRGARPRRGAAAARRGPRCRCSSAGRRHAGRAASARARPCAPRSPRSWASPSRTASGTPTARSSPSSPVRSARRRPRSAKPAGDVVLLAQTELGEVREAAPGGSSAMPHKQNPIAAVTARAAAAQAPGLVATLLSRRRPSCSAAPGAWHAEWPALSALLRCRRRGRARLRDRRSTCDVAAAAMARNLAGLAEPSTSSRHRARRRPRRRYLEQEDDLKLALPHRRPGGRATAGAAGLGRQHDRDVGRRASPPLAEQFRVVRIDHRGHGGSLPSPRTRRRDAWPTSAQDVARDPRRARCRAGADFAGLSLGAMVGMWLAIHRPERVGGSRCCARRPHRRRRRLPRAGADRARGRDGCGASEAVGRAVADARARASATRPASTAAARDGRGDRRRELCAVLRGASARWICVADLRRIAAPTLVVAGRRTTATPPEQPAHRRRHAGRALRDARRRGAHGDLRAARSRGRAVAEHFARRRDARRRLRDAARVLGDAQVDRAIAATTPFTAPFQQFLTRYAWGDVWSRDELARANDRSRPWPRWSHSAPSTNSRMHVRAARAQRTHRRRDRRSVMHCALLRRVAAREPRNSDRRRCAGRIAYS